MKKNEMSTLSIGKPKPECQPIPNINIGQVYDQRYADSDVHYETLGNLAGFFGRNMPVHRHDRFFQVHYVKSGAVRVSLDEDHYHQQGPMFFLTPPTIAHSFVTEPESTGHVLTVSQHLVWPLLEPEHRLANGPQISPVCVAFNDVGNQLHDEITHLDQLFDQIRIEFLGARAGRGLSLIGLTQLIFIGLLRLSTRSLKSQPAHHGDLQIFHRFNALIEARFQDHWPLTRYAAEISVTESRLNDICRRVAGLPSKRLIHERQMQEAKRLLLFTGSSVNEIGYQLGFKDPAYFSRFFTRNAGMTPGDYRHFKLSEGVEHDR